MSTTITIPASLVADVREATVYDLGLAARDLARQAQRPDADLTEPLERFDVMRRLLDALPAENDVVAQVDEAHAPVLLETLWEHTTSRANLVSTARSEGHMGVVEEYAPQVDALSAFMVELSTRGDA